MPTSDAMRLSVFCQTACEKLTKGKRHVRVLKKDIFGQRAEHHNHHRLRTQKQFKDCLARALALEFTHIRVLFLLLCHSFPSPVS